MKEIIEILKLAWSRETAFKNSKWNKNTPSIGQDDVTSLVINDFYGGKIMKCLCNDKVYYYNLINGIVVDCTKEQFGDNRPFYENSIEINRNYLLLSDDVKRRYYKLLDNFRLALINYNSNKSNTYDEINLSYLHCMFNFNTFNINNYYSDEEYDMVEFILTGEINAYSFKYIYIKNTKHYYLFNFSSVGHDEYNDFIIPDSILKQIFIVAKNTYTKKQK